MSEIEKQESENWRKERTRIFVVVGVLGLILLFALIFQGIRNVIGF